MIKPEYSILDFLKTFGINTTTNFELMEIAEYLGIDDDLVICMRNELHETLVSFPNKNKAFPKAAIINYQKDRSDYGDRNIGTHWVLLFSASDSPRGPHKLKSLNKQVYYYFDSFGIKPLKELEDIVTVYNNIQVQHYETNICEQLCIYVLWSLHFMHSPWEEIISELKELYVQLSLSDQLQDN